MARAPFRASASRRTCCATPSPRISSITALTCGWCSCCSATPTSPPRRSIRMSRASGLSSCTRSITHGANLALAALDRDADELRVRQDADLRDAHFGPRCAELAGDERRDAVGEGLDQAVMLRRGEAADAQRHLLVVDGVAHLVALEHRGARQADLQIDRQCLHHVPLAAVDADERFHAQVADDDGVHAAADSIESPRWTSGLQ